MSVDPIGLTPEQHVSRRGFIGGTDAPKILGVSPFGGPLSVYEDKMGLSDRRPAGPAGRWGSILEAPVAEEYARVTGRRLRRRKFAVIHKRLPFVGGYIDRDILGEPGIYEGKTASTFMRSDWGDPGSDEVPDDYYVQVQHYMACTGSQWCDIAVLLGGWEFRIYHVLRNDAFIVGLLDAEEVFWRDHVLAAVPPPVDGSEHSRDYLRRRYPEDDGEVMPATPEDEAMIYDLILARRNRQQVEAALTLAENRVKERIGINAGLAGAAGTVTWRAQQSNRADWRAIAHEWKNMFGLYVPSEHWERLTVEGNTIAQTHTATNTTRVLRVKESKDA